MLSKAWEVDIYGKEATKAQQQKTLTMAVPFFAYDQFVRQSKIEKKENEEVNYDTCVNL